MTGSPPARLIGLAAHAPGSGKSTAATELGRHGFRCISFAAPLKRMAESFLYSLGNLGAEEIKRVVYHDRQTVIPGINVTSRHLLQTLGTEWGRRQICPDVWLQCWSNTARWLLESGVSVVVDDVRFINEADLVIELGGQMWLIDRPSACAAAGDALRHASEGELSSYGAFSEVIDNSGDLDAFHRAINRALVNHH